ncbi:ATP-binding cassette domain-containing protein [Microbacterium pumilum]|uniref:ATP-binding cassette domain-containing protein n=1 Tax=Microbacterium pumilum TaxID=344165 RepID=A0ABP5EHG4_9MICO
MLRAEHIAKRYEAVVALADASITLRAGTVHGLVGDNGAGKSTFLKSLSGAVHADSGSLVIDGEAVVLRTPHDALAAGIETVYQDLALVDTMNAYQNVFLGREELSRAGILRFFGFLSDRSMRRQARAALDELGIGIPSIKASVKQMSGGQRQCLAMARAILWGKRIVILDEPTAALGVRETAQVVEVIKKLRDRGVAVLLVTHNMAQLEEIADYVTVMRLGRTIAHREMVDTPINDIVGLITGAIRPAAD